MEVSGLATNGAAGLEYVERFELDVVVLDLEMPVMGGLEFLHTLRRTRPDLPVVVFSALTSEGAEATIAAMAAGASAFALKPTNLSSPANQTVDTDLIGQLPELARHYRTRRDRRARPRPLGSGDVASAAPATRLPGGPTATLPAAVVIAVSTGGPSTLASLLPALPANLPVPILVVQHMPPTFTRLLAARLASRCDMEVVEATDCERIRPGVVYIAPGDRHLRLRGPASDVRVWLTEDPPENSCRPAADVLFRSAAKIYRNRTLGVVLTGMGCDGLAGSRSIVAAGGSVLIQDPSTAVVGSMPSSVLEAGLAEATLDVAGLAEAIISRVGRQVSQ
jgi:two-component system chemotaxis response regulator CheB